MARSSALGRSSSITTTCALISLAGGGGAAVAFSSGEVGWGFGLGLVCLVALLMLFWGSGEANCPVCGQKLEGFVAVDVRCGQCLTYSEGQGKLLVEIVDDPVRETPSYKIYRPQEHRMPRVCVACGAQPNRVEHIFTIELSVVKSFGTDGGVI